MQHNGIVVEELSKRFESLLAVDRVTFEVQPGEIFGFLGPNGAGKSTTVEMLTTLRRPTAGSIWVGGYDAVSQPQRVRRVSGVALQEIGLDPLMKSTELLTLQARLFGMGRMEARRRAAELLRLVRLEDCQDRRVGKYSGGMRRRLDLAMALVHSPRILFLDEPTTGLDPASRRDIWEEIRRLNEDLGMTIFLTTQYLEEADSLADRVAIIHQGRIAIEGTPEGLKSEVGGESINLVFASEVQARAAQARLMPLGDTLDLHRSQVDENILRLYVPDASAAAAPVIRYLEGGHLEGGHLEGGHLEGGHLEEERLRPVSLTLSQPTLDDVFLRVTGHRYESEEGPAAAQSGGQA